MKLFKDLNLNSNIQIAFDKLGFTELTEIQAKAIPILLNQEVDFHGQAQTGTGKTLAFGIPIIQKIFSKEKKIKSIIVAPTRELVLQICESLEKITKNVNISICPIYGGVSISKQINDLSRNPNIIVGTPGRLNDHIRRKTLSLKDVEVLVLDEADIMLDMGFKEEIDEILKFLPKNRKIWLFSATVKQGINAIKKKHMNNVVAITVSQNNVGSQNTEQFYCVSPMNSRFNTLCKIIDINLDFYGFIFCPTKSMTSEITEKLLSNGYNINCLHGDMDQSMRTRVINQFRQKKFSILVATDVAARGIDVPDITHVVNYCLPNDQESYVHRIGRTGRAGKTGIAITFINNSEFKKIKYLSSKFKVDIKPMAIPVTQDILKIQIKKAQSYLSTISNSTNGFSQELNSVLENFSSENIKTILINLISEKFFKKFEDYKNDVNEYYNKRLENRNLVEVELSLGLNDNVTQSDIVNYFINIGKVSRNDLNKVKVLRKKSFIVLPINKVDNIIPLLRNEKLNGKRARLSIVR